MKDWGLAKVTLNVADGSMKEDISSWLVFGLLVAVFAVAVLASAPVAASTVRASKMAAESHQERLYHLLDQLQRMAREIPTK